MKLQNIRNWVQTMKVWCLPCKNILRRLLKSYYYVCLQNDNDTQYKGFSIQLIYPLKQQLYLLWIQPHIFRTYLVTLACQRIRIKSIFKVLSFNLFPHNASFRTARSYHLIKSKELWKRHKLSQITGKPGGQWIITFCKVACWKIGL